MEEEKQKREAQKNCSRGERIEEFDLFEKLNQADRCV